MADRIRQRELKARRIRRIKLKMLRQRYFEANSKTGKEQVLEQLKRIAPWLTEEEFAQKDSR